MSSQPPQPLGQDQWSPAPGEGQQQPLQTQHQEPGALAEAPMKTYTMYYTTSRTNVRLHLGTSRSAPCVYYGESTFVPTSKPNIELRAGASKTSPAVAFAKIHVTSRNVQLGLGDYRQGDGLACEEMRRERFRLARSHYEFETDVGSDGGARRTFGWRVEKYYAKTIYQCVDEDGRVVASLRSGGMFNWSKGGEIDVVEGFERRLEELLIVSALAIFAAEAGWSVFSGYK